MEQLYQHWEDADDQTMEEEEAEVMNQPMLDIQ